MNFPLFQESNDLSFINQGELLCKDKLLSTHDDIISQVDSLKFGDYSCLYEVRERYSAFEGINEPQLMESRDFVDIIDQDSVFNSILQSPKLQNSTKQPAIIKKRPSSKKMKKNSNIIKKIGRIIIDNIDQYNLPNQQNKVKTMLVNLQNRANINDRLKNQKDGFNTSDLEGIYDDEKTSSFNLKTTRRIFTQKLRKDVLNSYQIKDDNKVMYLNSLKVSSLRFINKKLAVRLQISDGS